MTPTVKDIAAIVNRLAPPLLAEKWDNCGLQVGWWDRPVQTVRVALDPCRAVIAEASQAGADLLVTHHPLFISPLRSLDFSGTTGQNLEMAIQSGLSIFSAHTNLDSAGQGLNDICADKLGLLDRQVMVAADGAEYYKLAVFVPVDYEMSVLEALATTPAGSLGNYSACSFATPGTGRFQPSDMASPFIGQAGQVSRVKEVRLETIVAKTDLDQVIQTLQAAHPYETMAYDLFPLAGSVPAQQGLGRWGRVDPQQTLAQLARTVKRQFGLEQVRVAGDPDLKIDTVAVSSGSGSGLLGDFLKSPAQVYVSGDLKYHDAMTVVDSGRALIDAGHFETEIVVVAALVEKIRQLADQAGFSLAIAGCECEQSPFAVL